MRNLSSASKDAVSWKWPQGEQTMLAALGDPVHGNGYALCIYDESAVTPSLLFSAAAQQVGCPDVACWSAQPNGFAYRSTMGDDQGLSRIKLRAGESGHAKALVKGKGPLLSLNGLPTAPLALPLRVQLQSLELPTCLEAEYGAGGVISNTNGVFRARGTP
jgi:hypothetical protein